MGPGRLSGEIKAFPFVSAVNVVVNGRKGRLVVAAAVHLTPSAVLGERVYAEVDSGDDSGAADGIYCLPL